MPRQARVKSPNGIYHIIQQSSDGREIFPTEKERQIFWEVLTEASDRYSFRLLGYCLLDAVTYHLLLKLDGCDISSLMKSINISFMKSIDASAGLFRDRYQSVLIEDRDELDAIYQKMGTRAAGHDKWNSFCHFDQKALDAVGLELTHPVQLDIDDFDPQPDDALTSIASVAIVMAMELLERSMTMEEMLANTEVRDEFIYKCRLQSTLSLRQIGTLFGGLSESRVSKIIKEYSSSRAAEDKSLSPNK